MDFLLRVFAEIQFFTLSVIDRILEKVPPEKRRIVSVTAIAVFVVLIITFGIFSFSKGKPGGREITVVTNIPSGIFIPQDELFLPEEPDFVPGVLLERERRDAWTADDAASWWRDPLKNGEQIWRDQIEKTVDAIMGSVP